MHGHRQNDVFQTTIGPLFASEEEKMNKTKKDHLLFRPKIKYTCVEQAAYIKLAK